MLKRLSPFHSTVDLPHYGVPLRQTASLDLPRNQPQTPALNGPATPLFSNNSNGYFNLPANSNEIAYTPQIQSVSTSGGLDRATLQKSLKALEVLLSALDEFRELSSRLAKAQKKVTKAAAALALCLKDPSTSSDKDVIGTTSPCQDTAAR